MCGGARAKGLTYRWADSAARLDGYVDEILATGQEPLRLTKHLLRMSDVEALRALSIPSAPLASALEERSITEELARYAFAGDAQGTEAHYAEIASSARAEGNHHGLGNDQVSMSLDRVQQILPLVEELAQRGAGRVLDYGCGNGAITIALARRYPALTFVGADLVQSHVEEGGAYLAEERMAGRPVENVTLHHATVDALRTTQPPGEAFDLVLALEVLEHVPSPGALADQLEMLLRPRGRFCATFPAGPMESIRYAWFPFREHLHHLEPWDIEELWGRKKELRVDHFSWGEVTPEGEPVGGTMVTWRRAPDQPSAAVNYRRKLAQTLPRESLTTCMIVRATEPSLERALRSVRAITDQLVVAVDARGATEADVARIGALLDQYGAEWFMGESPLVVGFDAARNATLDRARGDWVLWIDADEELEYGARLLKFLQPNPYEAYSVAHVHLATEPPGVLQMDYPCRVFRRASGLRFLGVVHEHPSYSETQPPRHVMLLPDSIAVMHTGYATEQVRLERFRRNITLMQRDMATYPNRDLGKFLWVRDQTYLARFGGYATKQSRAYAQGAQTLWRELLRAGSVRFALDALPFMTETSVLLLGPQGVTRWRFVLDVFNGTGNPGGARLIEAALPSPEDARQLTELLVQDRYKPFGQRYY